MKFQIQARKLQELACLLPVIFMAAVVPLVVHLKIVPVELSILPYWTGEPVSGDLCDYYKSVFVVLSGIFSVFILLMLQLNDKMPRNSIGTITKGCNPVSDNRPYSLYWILLPLAVYISGNIFSTLLSDFRYVSIYGFIQRYEGLFVIFSYLAVFILILYLPINKAALNFINAAIIVSAAIISTLGIFEYYHFNFFTDTKLGKLLILPLKYHSNPDSINITWIPTTTNMVKNTITSTIGNSNYLGSYMVMLFPYYSLQALFAEKGAYKYFCMAITPLLFFNLLGSNSRAAYLGVVVTSVITIILAVKNRIRIGKTAVATIIMLFIVFLIINITTEGSTGKRIISMLSGKEPVTASVDKVKNFKIDHNKLILYCSKSRLTIKSEYSRLTFYDSRNLPLAIQSLPSDIDINLSPIDIKFSDKAYKEYDIQLDDSIIRIQKGNSYLRFKLWEESFRFIDTKGSVVQVVKIPSFGFKGMERFASSRGYIWSRTIPLLRKTVILGHGPDTFAMYFPQNDFMGKLNHMYDAYILIDKPHSMYLQTAVNTGIISLAALLLLFCYYLYQCYYIYLRRILIDEISIYGAAIFIAVAGYLAANLFNDSNVGVAPVFWVLLGLGLNINRQVKAKVKVKA